jgi:hypothetical protein
MCLGYRLAYSDTRTGLGWIRLPYLDPRFQIMNIEVHNRGCQCFASNLYKKGHRFKSEWTNHGLRERQPGRSESISITTKGIDL